MNWERIESARARARFLLAIPWLIIAFLVLVPQSESSVGPPSARLTISGPDASGGAMGMPVDLLLLAVGVFGMLFGFAWMWRIYRAPMRSDGAHWRFHDD
jgi:hypothetical protein